MTATHLLFTRSCDLGTGDSNQSRLKRGEEAFNERQQILISFITPEVKKAGWLSEVSHGVSTFVGKGAVIWL